MSPLKASQIVGTWATLLLPINEDDSIDFARLETEIDVIAGSGVNGVYSNGTAGEFHTLTEEEFDRTSELLAYKCERARLPFQIGVSHMSAQISRQRLRRAKALQPGAFQVILPDWVAVTDEEAVSFLQTMAEEADPIGLVLYNPPHAKRVLSPTVLANLARRVAGLVGVKVAAGEKIWWEQLGDAARQLSVFVPGHLLATQVPLGAAGAYSNVACLHPAGAQQWWNLMQRDLPAAQQLQRKLLAFFEQFILPLRDGQGYSNSALDKLLAAIGAWAPVGTRLRWPYRWVPLEHARWLQPIARQRLPELLELQK